MKKLRLQAAIALDFVTYCQPEAVLSNPADADSRGNRLAFEIPRRIAPIGSPIACSRTRSSARVNSSSLG